MLRSTLRFIAGAAVGLVLWIYLTPAYNRALSSLAEMTLTADRRLRGVELIETGRKITARSDGSRAGLPAVVIPADQLTYNIILLLGLFATNRAALRDRGAMNLAIALLILFATHVAATVIAVEATFATKTHAWGDANYGALARDFWAALEFGYRLFGMFGIAFGCWWLTRGANVSGLSEGRTVRG